MKKVARFAKISIQQFQKDCARDDVAELYSKIKLPKRATKFSAGYDFYAPFNIELTAGDTLLVPTGIRVKMSDDYFLAIFPRSGLGFRYRLQLDNTVGIIDADYYNAQNEGHVIIKLTNDSREGKTLIIAQGDGFAQGIFLEFALAEDDEVTEERRGGFGSTNK